MPTAPPREAWLWVPGADVQKPTPPPAEAAGRGVGGGAAGSASPRALMGPRPTWAQLARGSPLGSQARLGTDQGPPQARDMQRHLEARAPTRLGPPMIPGLAGLPTADLDLRPQGQGPSPPARQSHPRCPAQSPGLQGPSWTAQQPSPPSHPSPQSAPPRFAALCPPASWWTRALAACSS